MTMTTNSLLKSLFCVCDSSSNSSANENPQDSDSSRSPETGALGIHLILKNILENLEPCDLLTCRLVSSSWNNLVSTLQPCQDRFQCQSLRTPPFQMTFRYHDGQYFLHQKYPKMAPRSLSQFLDFLEKSRNHPSSFPVHLISFKFFGGRLDDPELQRFLTRFGGRLNDLELDLDPVTPNHHQGRESGTTGLVHTLIVKQLPNLRFLNIPRELSSSFLTFPGTLCSALRNLVAIKGTEIPTPFMEKLVTYCPNLRSISFSVKIDTLPFLRFLMTSQKVGLIKNLVFCPRFQRDEEQQKLIAVCDALEEALALDLRPSTLHVDLEDFKYETLIFNAQWFGFETHGFKPTVTSLLLKILASGVQSLHKVRIRMPLYGHAPNQWPIMTGVESIELDMRSSSELFFQNFNVWVKFPNVKCVKLIFQSSLYNGEEGGPCQFSGVAVNVRKLEFPESLYPQSYLLPFPRLPTLFPNLEELTIDNVEDFGDLTKIWACITLKILKLTLHLDRINKPSEMDSVFTGFPVDTCERLDQREKPMLKLVEMSPDYLRTNSSIVNLKRLERLTIKIVAVRNAVTFSRVMSEVTGKYAFDCLPSLVDKVTIGVELKQWGDLLSEEKCKIKYKQLWTALADIAPYANTVMGVKSSTGSGP